MSYELLREWIPTYNVIYATRWSDNQYVRKVCVQALMAHNVSFGVKDGILTVVDSNGDEHSTNERVQDYMVIVDPVKHSAHIVVEADFLSAFVPMPEE